MKDEGYTIFLSTPEMYTIRAKFPLTHPFSGMVADFVLARKEVGYIEGTRRPKLELGTLYDDLIRRDFTVNAMAEAEDGTIIDPFYGRLALQHKILDTPTDPEITFMDDPLRMLRAIRFSITKGLDMENRVYNALQRSHFWDKMVEVVSMERVREELTKCFKANTIETLNVLTELGKLDYIFRDGLWLKPTFEK
jgi:tRNA nucleotidyltransferase/poly(A) polymerase